MIFPAIRAQDFRRGPAPFTPSVDAKQAGMDGGVANFDPGETANIYLHRNLYSSTSLYYGVRAACLNSTYEKLALP